MSFWDPSGNATEIKFRNHFREPEVFPIHLDTLGERFKAVEWVIAIEKPIYQYEALFRKLLDMYLVLNGKIT